MLLGLGEGSQFTVSVLLGNNDGTFQEKASYVAGFEGPMASGDFNGDGIPDLVLIGYETLAIYLGNPDGSLQNPMLTSNGFSASVREPTGIVLADFNGDGKLDMFAVNGSSTACVYLGNGAGAFQETLFADIPGQPTGVAAVDLNGDGKPDIVLAGSDNGASTMLGNGDGTFQQPVGSPAPYASGIAAGDYNGDGIPDLVTFGLGGMGILPGAVADLGISAVTSGNFTPGQDATVTITVSNGPGGRRPAER